MHWVDLILDLVALLLWLLMLRAGVRMATRSGGPGPRLAWWQRLWLARRYQLMILAALAALLAGRGWLYWRLGPALGWVPYVDLGAVALVFNVRALPPMWLYSGLSFGVTVSIYYLWLIFLSVINRKLPDTESLQSTIRRQLGWFQRFPLILKVLLPFVAVFVLWYLGHDFLTQAGLMPRAVSELQVVQRGLILAAGIVLAWKYLILGLLALHWVGTYLYVGSYAVLGFAHATARALLWPIGFLPLTFGRLDFAPPVAAAIYWGGMVVLEKVLFQLFQRAPL
jgi:hypothetical protein